MNTIRFTKSTAATLVALLASTFVSCSAFDNFYSQNDGNNITPETLPEKDAFQLLSEKRAKEDAVAAEIAKKEQNRAFDSLSSDAKDCNGESLTAEQLPLFTKLSTQFDTRTCRELILRLAGVEELDLSKAPEEACVKSFNDDKTGVSQNKKFFQIGDDDQIAADRISDISLLKHFPNLKTLNISFLPITDLTVLSSLTQLETLKINRCNVVYTTAQSADFMEIDIPRVKDISFVAAMPKLRELSLKGNAFNDISLVISSLPALEYLEVGKDRFTPKFAKIESVKGISDLSSLTNLNISGNQIFGEALNEVAQMEQLVQLDLDNNNIRDVSVLGSLSALVPSTNDKGKLINPLKLFGNPIARTVSREDQSCIKTEENCPTTTASEALNLFCSGKTPDASGNCL